ncbi:uncharacterized protein LOC135435361 [Drosophila montana]|uniref:uncharacterized protein LOC135435361 n=1 Tax=Drosophila montana TaxID=40370 RepID=UPI00313D3F83
MFRLYELYSLYLKKMASYGTSPTWCLCEKLPRSILHIAPTPELWCEVCGRRRRPRACISSSSDEEEKAAVRQQMLAERRRSEEGRQGSVRVKVAMTAKKPKPRRKASCMKCGGEPKPPLGGCGAGPQQSKSKGTNHKLYAGRFGHYRKPQRLQAKRKDEDAANGPMNQIEIEPVATAPPPPPSPPPSPPAYAAKPSESLWEQPSEDMPNLVAFAHEVFNRPLHLRKRQPSFYDNLFVSDFIPLDKPITDSAGGAISKRRRLFGRPLRSHCSRPLPPLSQVLSEILAKQKVRAKGGGLAPKEEEPNGSNEATQFSPFDIYEGPSEDALVVDSARLVLRQPKALHIKQRADLPPTRLSSFESEPSSDCSSSSPFDVPSAPPAERQRHSYSVGAPLRLHEMMKAVAHSGLSDSSASSSSSSSSSHKSASSTLPVHQQSVRSRGGEEPPYIEEKPAEPELLPISIIEKILWLMEQKPATENGPTNPLTDDALQQISLIEKQDEHIENSHSESVKGLLQFMESLHITDAGESDDNRSEILNNDAELKIVDTPVPESHHPNDMSNELPLNSSNKSAGDEKYVNIFSNGGNRPNLDKGFAPNRRARLLSKPTSPQSRSSGSTSMWSIISGLFTSKQSSAKPTLSSSHDEEMKPLKRSHNLHYGTINAHNTKPTKPSHPVQSKEIKESKRSCQRCGLNRKKKNVANANIQNKLNNCCGAQKPCCRPHSSTDSKITTTSPCQTTPGTSSTRIELKAKLGKPNIIINKKCKINREELKKSVVPKSLDSSKLGASITNGAAECPTPAQSVTNSSTHFESCFGIASPSVKPAARSANLKPGPELKNNLLQELLDKLKASKRQKQPTVYHAIRTLATVRHASSEIINPKMVAVARDVTCASNTGQMQQYIVSPAIVPESSLGIYEFRTPDIQAIELAKSNANSKQGNLEEKPTPIAHSETCPQTDESSVNSNVHENKSRVPQKKSHPVWPAHPFRHRKGHIKYKAMELELSYALSDENMSMKNKPLKESVSKENKTLKNRKRRKNNEMWIVNEMVHQKINEMMTKPIKLLSVNESKALQT